MKRLVHEVQRRLAAGANIDAVRVLVPAGEALQEACRAREQRRADSAASLPPAPSVRSR